MLPLLLSNWFIVPLRSARVSFSPALRASHTEIRTETGPRVHLSQYNELNLFTVLVALNVDEAEGNLDIVLKFLGVERAYKDSPHRFLLIPTEYPPKTERE